MKKNKVLLYLCVAIFGVLGIYLTFFASNVGKYDSQTRAYKIYPNESSDTDGNTIYNPIYFFNVKGKDYECKSSGSSFYPKEGRNTVYFDSKNPENCKTEYDKSTNRVGGIICLVVTIIMVYFFIIKKPSDVNIELKERQVEYERNTQIDQEQAEKVVEFVGKAQLIYKKIILGVIIAILLVFILIDSSFVKQTVKSKNYPEVVATYVSKKEESESSVFDDYIYSFIDKQGNEQEIIVSVSKNEEPEREMKIKYNENNPKDYYTEGMTMDKSGLILYIVKIVALILLVILFFNKKLLSKVNVSSR